MVDEQQQEEEELQLLFRKSNEVISLVAKTNKDRTKLFIDCERSPEPASQPGEKKFRKQVTPDDIFELLVDSIPKDNIDLIIIDSIVKAVNEGKIITSRRIARGIPAVDGEDGKLVLMVKKFVQPEQNRDRESSGTDLRHMHAFDNIKGGMQVGRIYPPSDGKDGVDVFGKPIKAIKGKPIRILLDKTIKVMPHPAPDPYEMLVAESEGYLAEDGNKLKIVNELIVQGDVDFVTSSIDFIGSVKIAGGIMKGFSVIAKGNIEIKGNVEEAYVESLEGSILVMSNITGHFISDEVIARDKMKGKKLDSIGERPNIRAKGGLRAFRIQGSKIEVGENVEIDREAMNCVIRTKKGITSPTAQLLAGEFNTGEGVDARMIGSDGGSRTIMRLSSGIETSSEFAALLSNIKQQEQAAELIKLQVGPYAQNPEKLKALPDLQKQKIIGILQKLQIINSSIAALYQEKDNLLKQGTKAKQIRVNFRERIYKETEVTADEKVFRIETDIIGPQSIVYLTDKKEFKIGSVKPLTEEEVFPEEKITETEQTKENS